MKIFIISLLLFFITSLTIITKDIVITKDGNKLVGEIIERTENKIIIRLNEDNIYKINKNDVKEISTSKEDKLSNGNLIDLSSDRHKSTKINDSQSKIEYHQVGIHFIYPGGINLNYAFAKNQFQIGFELGTAFNFITGFEMNYIYLFEHSDNFKYGLNFAIGYQKLDLSQGYSRNPIESVIYPALAFNINYYGFFVTLGLSYNDVRTLATYYLLSDFIYTKIGYSLKLR